jgi:hypothetical protein
MRAGRWMTRKPRPGKDKPSCRPRIGLEDYLDEPFAISDQVLLCCFGLDPDASGACSAAQLRAALLDAGFTATVARHLIHTSPLLRRAANDRYLLREFDG